MEIYTIPERPLALRAACAQVPMAPVSVSATSSAHFGVGGGEVSRVTGVEAQQIQLQGQRSLVQGTNGLVVQHYPTAKPVGGLRGVPPREKPV